MCNEDVKSIYLMDQEISIHLLCQRNAIIYHSWMVNDLTDYGAEYLAQLEIDSN